MCEKEKNNRKNKGNLSHAGDVFAVVLFVSFDTDVLSAAFDALAILPLPTAIIHDLPC